MQNSTVGKALYLSKLKSAGLRNTHVRSQLFDVMDKAPAPMSIKQLAESIKDAHFVSIYRSVDALQKAGILKLVPQGFKNLFELSDSFKPHHHHATCEECDKSVEVQDAELEEMMTKLALKAGITPTRHHFELYGICKDCKV